jgi:hypothetical protein
MSLKETSASLDSEPYVVELKNDKPLERGVAQVVQVEGDGQAGQYGWSTLTPRGK